MKHTHGIADMEMLSSSEPTTYFIVEYPKTKLLADPSDLEKKDKQEKKHTLHKHKKPRKGIERMFRISFSNHQRLSNMADQNARIMIFVNTIILPAVIGPLLLHVHKASNLPIPTCLLLAVSFTTIVFAMLDTRSTIPSRMFTREEQEGKKVNLLFFGDYYKMPIEDYTEGMECLMEDVEYLYDSMSRNGHARVKIIGKKYGLLRQSYNVFKFSLIL